MKVTHNKVGQNLNLVDGKKTDKASNATDALLGKAPMSSEEISSAAKVNISTRAQDVKKAKEIAMSTPDIDEAKVAHFQKLIDSGQYKVNSAAVADKMIDEELKNI